MDNDGQRIVIEIKVNPRGYCANCDPDNPSPGYSDGKGCIFYGGYGYDSGMGTMRDPEPGQFFRGCVLGLAIRESFGDEIKPGALCPGPAPEGEQWVLKLEEQ